MATTPNLAGLDLSRLSRAEVLSALLDAHLGAAEFSDPLCHAGRLVIAPATFADDGRWVTLENGTHVFIENGRITKGPAALLDRLEKQHKVVAEHGKLHPETGTKEGPKEKGDKTSNSASTPVDNLAGAGRLSSVETKPAEGGKVKEPHEMSPAEYLEKHHIDPTRGMSTNNYSVPGAKLATGYDAVVGGFKRGMQNGKGRWQAGLEEARKAAEEVKAKVAAFNKPPKFSDRQFAAFKKGMVMGAEKALADAEAYYQDGKSKPNTWGDPRVLEKRKRELADELDKEFPTDPIDHQAAVFHALKAGKTVSPEILAHYPHLKDVKPESR